MTSLVSYPVSSLRGDIRPPGDKSLSHRSILFASLGEKKVQIKNLLRSQDVDNTVAIFRKLGVRIDEQGELVVVAGVGMRGLQPCSEPLDCGNSGTAMRLLCGLLSAQNFSSVLVGDSSLSMRPMARVIEPLRLMGAEIESKDGHAPLVISQSSPLKAIEYTLPQASAQVKSAILLAGLYAEGMSVVHEPIITRSHTEDMLLQCNVEVATKDNAISMAGPIHTLSCPDSLNIPADLSSASFFLLAAQLCTDSCVTVRDVNVSYSRTGILDFFCALSANISQELITHQQANITMKHTRLNDKLFEFSPELVARAIDEIPAIAVVAAMRPGITIIRGAQELRVKESDRISATVNNLKLLGKKVEEYEDGMKIYGDERPFQKARLPSYSDHRIAMSFSLASLAADGPITIENSELIETSFPRFVETMNSIGAKITIRE